MKPIDPTLASEAVSLVTGPRQAAYAHPAVNFGRIAKMWSVALETEVTPQQVAMCMVMVKLSREMNDHRRDNIVDGIGYLIALDACEED